MLMAGLYSFYPESILPFPAPGADFSHPEKCCRQGRPLKSQFLKEVKIECVMPKTGRVNGAVRANHHFQFGRMSCRQGSRVLFCASDPLLSKRAGAPVVPEQRMDRRLQDDPIVLRFSRNCDSLHGRAYNRGAEWRTPRSG